MPVDMKKLKQNGWLSILSIGFTCLVLEIMIRFFDLAPATPKLLYDASNHIVKFEPNQTGIISFGKLGQKQVNYRINNCGWNSAIDYDTADSRPLIAVIGDSYIQAMQVGVKESYPALLRQKLKNKYRVYSFGFSGAALSQYVSMSEYVHKTFKPEIIIFNSIHNDFDESFCHLKGNGMGFMCLDTVNYQTHYFDFQEPKTMRSAWLHKMIYSSALVRYLTVYGNVKNGWQTKPKEKYNQNIDPIRVKALSNKLDRAIEVLLGKIKNENSDSRILFVMDGLRNDIYKNTVSTSNLAWLQTLMKEKVTAKRMEFIDLTEPFFTDYQRNKTHFESEIDYHWNEYGHQKVAEVVEKYLVENKIGIE
jgi:hypothetical protein